MAKKASKQEHMSGGETAAAIGKAERANIQGLLKEKTAESVKQALAMLESLGATTTDYEAVFSESMIKSVLNGWVAESWGAVAKALLSHGSLSETFQKLAEERFLTRPQKYGDIDKTPEPVNALLHARMPTARASFLAMRVNGEKNRSPFIDCVAIPAGAFTMHPISPTGEPKKPVSVRITKPFHIGRTVVTQSQWRAVMGTDVWRYEDLPEHFCGDDFPAVHVNWADAMLFCQALTDLEREAGQLTAAQRYRLPTEAEWEYACRAGTTTRFSFGDIPDELADYGWYSGNSECKVHEVAKKKPNPWGLFDMHGNVDEFCSDWWWSFPSGGDDPTGPVRDASSQSGWHSDDLLRVLRGGNANCSPIYCGSGFRERRTHGPWYRYGNCGFRVVLCEQ
jgi:formylglycine-generating enzyme required for sulfatase activity